jgi:hypothetical protein
VASRDWSNLSPAQQKRYVGAGRTGSLTGQAATPAQVKSFYESGALLRGGRGAHTLEAQKKYVHPVPKSQRPPVGATNAALRGDATPRQLKQLETWKQKRAPKWVRDQPGLSEDTAAFLVRANLQPKNWRDVNVYYQKDGTVFVYIESKRGGPTRKIHLPDATVLDEVVGVVNKQNTRSGVLGDLYDDRYADDIDVHTFGYRKTSDAA